MQRYFFDISINQHIRYDYRGRDFAPSDAEQFAELIALDLECTGGEEPHDMEVQVRDVGGRQLFSIPVRKQETELSTA